MLFKKYKKAFTLIEFISVIILIGILTGVFTAIIPNNQLVLNKKYLIEIINKKRENGLVWNHIEEKEEWEEYSKLYDNTCLNLDIYQDRTQNNKSQIDREEELSKINKKYFLNLNLKIKTNLKSSLSKICFDSQGTPYDGNYYLKNIIKNKVILELELNGKKDYIYILPFTGQIIF